MKSHTERMRVQWVDTDASGRIHYTAALRYFEVAEHALMRSIFGEVGAGPGNRGFMMPRVHVEADYRSALRYPDEFDCTAQVASIGRTSVTYGYRAVCLDGEVCLEGKIVCVAVAADGVAMELPDDFRSALTG
jgi:acyl-CoA thioester hydrolase